MLSEGLAGKSATNKYHTVVQFHVSAIKKKCPRRPTWPPNAVITVVFALYTNKFHRVSFLVCDIPLGPPWVTKVLVWDPLR